MGDLSKKKRGTLTKLIGVDSNGSEENYIKGYITGDLATGDVIDGGGVHGTIDVLTTAIEVKVGVTALEGRKCVTLDNSSGKTIYWGHDNTVTTANGTRIWNDQQVRWAFTENTSIWVISANATTGICRITESKGELV